MQFIPLIAAGISAAGSIIGNQMSAEAAEDSRDWQKSMSDTAHQREVADLRAAGLNPILSATGGRGASTPPGALANVSDPLGPAVNSALTARMMNAQIEKLRAETEATQAVEHRTQMETQGLMWDLTARAPHVGPRGEGLSSLEQEARGGALIESRERGPQSRAQTAIRVVASHVAERFGLSTARETLYKIEADVARALGGAARDFYGSERERQEARRLRIENDISETAYFREIERGIGALGAGASAVRNLGQGLRMPDRGFGRQNSGRIR